MIDGRALRRLTRRDPNRRPWATYTPVITWTVVVAYAALAIGMTTQPDRFANTPSYANLLELAPSQLWGCGYLLVAAFLFAWRLSQERWVGVVAHTVASALTVWWLGAFVVRYSTDNGTTIVNVVSWAVFLSLVIRSSIGLDTELDDETEETAPRVT